MIALLLLAFEAPDQALAERFARLALACVHKEYPNKIAHEMSADADAQPPRSLTPAFYGCFDWHSAVHGHWQLARFARVFPASPVAIQARAALAKSITKENIAREVAYMQRRKNFERPYGLAWLLQLSSELRQSKSPLAANLQPLTDQAIAHLSAWLPKLSYPVRTGEHSQTAFALGLFLDYATSTGNTTFRTLLEQRARAFYQRDQACPIHYEPGGQDFLSPCLAEADVMRRILPPAEFARWFDAFLPVVDKQPEKVTDPTDGQLAHLDGLNLSRAWMLTGIAESLPTGHPRRARLQALALAHRNAGVAAVNDKHYEGSHWLGSFALYLTTRVSAPAARP